MKPTKRDAERFMYAALVECHIDLAQEWQGWKIRGRYLVTPEGDRLSVRRLLFLAQAEHLRDYRAKWARKRGDDPRANVVAFPIERRVAR